MRNLNLLAGLVLISLCGSSASAQNNNFFNRGGVGLFNPIIDVVNTGDRLVVQPVVSADRKYVTIGGQYQSANLISIQNFPVFGIANGQGGGVVGGGGAVQAPQSGAAFQHPVIKMIPGVFGVSARVVIMNPAPGRFLKQGGFFLFSPP